MQEGWRVAWHRGVRLPQEAGGRVARIDEDFLANGALPLVELLEVVTPHEGFTAHVQHRWRADGAQPQRNTAYRSRIGRDILPDTPVSSCRRTHQHARLVAQAQRYPVELQLRVVL